MKNVDIIVQARMGSNRLPGKVLKCVVGKPLIQHTIERLRLVPLVRQIVLATSVAAHDDVLADWARSFGVLLYRGSEDNVLSRFYEVACKYQPDDIVRITGDCPLIEATIVEKIIKKHLDTESDYTSNTLKRTFPRGWDAEIFTRKSLQIAFQESQDVFDREHVTPFIWKQPKRFRHCSFEAEGVLRRPDIRICVDTIDDFLVVEKIFQTVDNQRIALDAENIIRLFEKYPQWLQINSHVVQKHS